MLYFNQQQYGVFTPNIYVVLLPENILKKRKILKKDKFQQESDSSSSSISALI